MHDIWHAHSDLDWYGRSGPTPAKPHFPASYWWHLGPTWEDAAALEDRAEAVALECEAIECQLVAANDRGDTAAYEAAEEEFAIADRELSLLYKRIEELS
jgi:hypothetical protein